MYFRPGPGQDAPGPADLASDQRFNRPPLRGTRPRIDQNDGLAVALVNGAGPVDVDGEVQAVELDPVTGSFLDVPGPAPLDRKSTRLNSSHIQKSRMPSSA